MKYILETIFVLCVIFIIVLSLIIGSYVLHEEEANLKPETLEISCSYECIVWDYKYECIAWMYADKCEVETKINKLLKENERQN